MYLVITMEQGRVNTDFTKVFDSIGKASDYLVETAKDYDVPDVSKDMELKEIEEIIEEELEFSGQDIKLLPIQKG